MEESNRAAERLAHIRLMHIIDDLAVENIKPLELVVRAGNQRWDVELRIRPAQFDGASKKTGFTPCERDILETLRESGCNLTTTVLIETMELQKRIHGASTIRASLARLVRRGVLGNNTVEPRGYYLLPE